MLTLTTTQFRQNLAEVFSKVLAGQEVELILGRGKKAKKIKLTNQTNSQSGDDSISKHSNIHKFISSPNFKNYKTDKIIMKTEKVSKFLLDDKINGMD
jgi:hypothetical protein